MPVVSVERDLLFEALEKEYTEEEFDELCFDYGIELDDVATDEDGKIVYKIDLPANRYDLLCLEGLKTALMVFLGKQESPVFKVVEPTPEVAKQTKMNVSASTAQIRPFVVCAVLRGITLSEARYQSFLDLQDHLHRNICRKRTLVAIGTHDLDSLQGPFTYEALPPSEIKFRHLMAEEEMGAKEMLDWFREDPAGKHIKEYTGIIYDSPVYPVIMDAKRTVLSLPPIINGYHSKISPATRNVFIECTGTDRTKAEIVLNTIVAMFSMYCDQPFTVEPVLVQYEQEPHADYGTDRVFPNMTPRAATASLSEMCSTIGVQIPPEDACEMLKKMMLGPATYDAASEKVVVTVPVTRSDILHPVDVYEDLAIAYGYNNLVKTIPVSHTPGKELPINLLSDLMRSEIAMAGYTEILSLGLLSNADNFDNLQRPRDGTNISIANPKNMGFQVARTTLIPGLLKTMAENLNLPISQTVRLFEISDVVLKDPTSDVGARNERRMGALYTGPTAGFEVIHGLVDRMMQLLYFVPSEDYAPDAAASAAVRELVKSEQAVGSYKVVDVSARNADGSPSTFLDNRAAKLVCRRNGEEEYVEVGEFGIVHPKVMMNFKLSYPVSVCELNLQYFL